MMVFATKWYCNGIGMGLNPQTWGFFDILTYYNQSQWKFLIHHPQWLSILMGGIF